MAKRIYYRCEKCQANMTRSMVRAFGARCLCPNCYAWEITIAIGDKYLTKEGAN